MTLQIEPAVLDTLSASGTQNNPIIAWNNFLNGGGCTVSTSGGTELEDGPALNATTGTTYDYWSANPSGAAVNLLFEFNATRSPDFAGISAHNLADLGATVAFQRWTGSAWAGVGTGSVSPATNEAIGFYFDADGSTQWRMRITNVADTQAVIVGNVFLGDVMTMPTRVYQGYTPARRANNVMLQTNVSEGGNLLGSTVVRKGIRLSASFRHLTPNFIRGDDNTTGFQNFIDHFNNGKPFYWAWRPNRNGDLYWCWRSGNVIDPTNSGPKRYQSFSMDMAAYYDE